MRKWKMRYTSKIARGKIHDCKRRSSQENELDAFNRFDIRACDRQTDRQTDTQVTHRPSLLHERHG